MSSAVTVQNLASRMSVESLVHVPGSSAATVVTPDSGTTKQYRDLRDYEYFGFGACNAVLVGNGITLLEILGAVDIAGTNAQVIVASGTLSGTSLGNGGWLEIEAAQLREIAASSGFNLRFVVGRITVANSGDKCAVTYVRGGAKHPGKDLTPATM